MHRKSLLLPVGDVAVVTFSMESDELDAAVLEYRSCEYKTCKKKVLDTYKNKRFQLSYVLSSVEVWQKQPGSRVVLSKDDFDAINDFAKKVGPTCLFSSSLEEELFS